MERMKMTSHYISTTVAIEETWLKAFSKDNRENYSYQVFDGQHVGIQYVQGRGQDEDGYAKAQDNLSLERPYGFPLETGERHRDKTETVYTDQQIMSMAREAVEYLADRHPDFSFSGSVRQVESLTAMKNSLGLDYSDRDCITNFSFRFKHKDSKDITDGWLGLGQRTFDMKKFTDMAENFLDRFTNMVELPEELIIQDQYYGYISKFYECLDAENIALGTSLFSGKIGEKLFSDSFTMSHDVSDEVCWQTPFFDGEGVVLPGDRSVFIENGVLVSGYADKFTARKYGVPHTGSANRSFSDIPTNGNVNLRITPSDKTVKELLGGRLSVVPIVASGGGFNEKGEFVMPVQCAVLCDGERILGRLPEFTMKGSIYDIFGDGFIGVTGDKPLVEDHCILMKMEYSR